MQFRKQRKCIQWNFTERRRRKKERRTCWIWSVVTLLG